MQEHFRGVDSLDGSQSTNCFASPATSLQTDLVMKNPSKISLAGCFQASIQMEAMDCKGALQIGIDLLDRFGQGESSPSFLPQFYSHSLLLPLLHFISGTWGKVSKGLL